MSRSILLPLLALGGLILFGTTRAARPAAEPEPPPVRIEGPTRTPITERAEPRPAPMPEPPPAPRLRSEVEAEVEAEAPEPAADTVTVSDGGSVPFRVYYVPAESDREDGPDADTL